MESKSYVGYLIEDQSCPVPVRVATFLLLFFLRILDIENQVMLTDTTVLSASHGSFHRSESQAEQTFMITSLLSVRLRKSEQ